MYPAVPMTRYGHNQDSSSSELGVLTGRKTGRMTHPTLLHTKVCATPSPQAVATGRALLQRIESHPCLPPGPGGIHAMSCHVSTSTPNLRSPKKLLARTCPVEGANQVATKHHRLTHRAHQPESVDTQSVDGYTGDVDNQQTVPCSIALRGHHDEGRAVACANPTTI